MKIPIQLQFKLFDDVFIVKKKVDHLHVSDVADMYKSVFVPIPLGSDPQGFGDGI